MNYGTQSMTLIGILILYFGSSLAQERTFSELTEVPLKSLEGGTVKLSRFKGTPVVLEFFNPDCPFVKRAHHRASFKTLIQNTKRKGAVWLAINANGLGRQGAGLERNRRAQKELGLNYPILLNETGQLGRLLGATRTPEFFVFDAKGMLVYQGGLDSTGGRQNPGESTINWLHNALNQYFMNERVTHPQTKPWGCSIKYNEPKFER